jgi:hypothetical protein
VAIGIPLSSLDVVVGISGVHYVLQGLRQIDREIDSTSKKRVSTALEIPDLGNQVRNIQGSTASGVNGLRQMTSAIMDLQRAAAMPVANQGVRQQARETIALANEARQAATLANATARDSARAATVAEQAYNTALRERTRLQTQLAAAQRAQAKTALDIADLQGKTLATARGVVSTQSGAGIRAATILANPASSAAARAKADLYLQTEALALEQRWQARVATLQTRQGRLQTGIQGVQANLGALPNIAPLQTTAGAARAEAAALEAAAIAAGNHSTQLQRASVAAQQYLGATAGFVTRGQQIRAVLSSLVGFVAGIGRTIMGLAQLGIAAGSAALEVGKFAVGILRLPVIMGPLTGGLSLIAENFVGIAKSIGLVVAALAGLTFKELITEGTDFEEAMANVRAVAQYTIRPDEGQVKAAGGDINAARVAATADEMERLDYITLKLGADTIFSNTEIANIIETMLRGGVDIGMVTQQTVSAVASLASATKTDVTDTASTLAAVIKMFGATGEEIPHFADIIAGAVNTTNQSVADFGSALRQLGPLAQALGISFEDTATLISQVAAKGFFGEIAGTSLRNMLLYLTPRTKPAIQELKDAGLWTGGTAPTMVVSEEDQLAFAAKQANYQTQLANYETRLQNYNVEMAQFNAGKRKTRPTIPIRPTAPTAPKGKEVAGETGHSAFYDEQGNLKSIPEIIRLLQAATKGMSDEDLSQFNDRVFGKRSGSASLLLTKDDADQFQKTKELITSISASSVAAFRLENIKGKVELLTGSLKSLAAVFFMGWLQAPILGAFNKLIPLANSVLEWFGKKGPDKMTQAQKFFGALGRGLTTGNLGAAWVDMMGAAPGLSSNEWSARIRTIMRWLQLGRDAVITFGEAWRGTWQGAATSSINPLIRAIGTLATWWGTLWRSIKQLLGGEISIRQFATQIWQGFSRLIQDVTGLLRTWTPGDTIKSVWNGLVDFGKWAWTTLIQPSLTELWGNITGYFTEEKKAEISTNFGKLFDWGKDLLAGKVGPAIGGLFDEVEAWFDNPKNKAMLEAKASVLGTTIGNLIGKGLKAVFPITIDVLARVKDFLASDTAKGLGAAISRLYTDALFGIAEGVGNLGTGMDDLWKKIFGAVHGPSGAQGAGKDAGFDIMKGLKGGLGDDLKFLFNSPIGGFIAQWIMVGAIIADILVNSFLLAVKAFAYMFLMSWDQVATAIGRTKLGQMFGIHGFDAEDWKRIDASVEHDIRPVPIASTWADFLKELREAFKPPVDPQASGSVVAPKPWGEQTGFSRYNSNTGHTDIWDYDTMSYVDERLSKPRTINPITGTQAPTGSLWVYAVDQQKWVLFPASMLLQPEANPRTGQRAPEGYKWVFDARANDYALYPVSDIGVGGAVPQINGTEPQGMVWIWDPVAKAYTLVWAGQGPPSKPPLEAPQIGVNVVTGATLGGQDDTPPPGYTGTQGEAGDSGAPPWPGPSYDRNTYEWARGTNGMWHFRIKGSTGSNGRVQGVPPVPASGGTSTGGNQDLGRNPNGRPPVTIVVYNQGTTDDVYMRKLNDTLDGLVAKYNGTVTA